MSNQKNECDDSKLGILLSDDERSDEFRKLSAHLESCSHCQNRLTVLAADHEVWDDVSSLLSGYEGTDEFVVGNSSSSLVSDLDLGFLSPPSHPEMLGRIGRYEIEKVIGSGGMGVVLKGHDTELNRPVAIKVLAPFLAHSGAARQRFAREGRAAAAVVHEHVVAIHNVETDAEMPFLVMQYVPGQSLQTRVDAHGPLEAKEILRIGIQAAAGLSAAHEQGVVHRDVKPSNILLENDVERALLTDFGLARAVDDATVTRTGVVTGTPHYMSPEQASGEATDNRSDLFSLGALMYFMATGHPPFRAERALAVLNRICNDRHRPVWEINPDIPDELSDIIDRLLEKKPARRFANAEQTHDALLKLLENLQQPGAARRRSRFRRWFRNHRRQFAIGVTAIAGVAVVALALNGIFNPGDSDITESPKTGAMEFSGVEKKSGAESDDTPQELSNLITTETNPENEFATELTDVEKNIQQIEEAASTDTGLFLNTNTDNWKIEMEAIKHRVFEMEKSLQGNDHPKK
jgi:eukaryotic-like serine/threonine-protein kinase